MRARVLSQVLAATAIVALASGPAAAASIFFTSGAATATAPDNGTTTNTGGATIGNDSNPAVGTINVAGSIGGWTVDVTLGRSKSPSAANPFGLDLAALVECSGSCSELLIDFSDTGFTTAAGGFTFGFSATDTGGDSSSGTAGEGEGPGGLTTEVGPFFGAGSFSGAGSGGGPASGSYSLVIIEGFVDPNAVDASFSTNASLTAVPEPASLFLMGTGLLGLATLGRKLFAR